MALVLGLRPLAAPPAPRAVSVRRCRPSLRVYATASEERPSPENAGPATPQWLLSFMKPIRDFGIGKKSIWEGGEWVPGSGNGRRVPENSGPGPL